MNDCHSVHADSQGWGATQTTQHSIPSKSEKETRHTVTLDKHIRGLDSSNDQMPAFNTHRTESASAMPSPLPEWTRWPAAAWFYMVCFGG